MQTLERGLRGSVECVSKLIVLGLKIVSNARTNLSSEGMHGPYFISFICANNYKQFLLLPTELVLA